ncbi:MAG: TetR/AcrR family transcriptional regulator [Actinomycetota bacterium]|nr:TetR/AcrR family transcriptional regulator [Actinomycetota bacterium]
MTSTAAQGWWPDEVVGRRAAEPASKRAAATRRALLDGAADTFAERGYERATVAEIVERSGASVGSLYNLFGGKEELFRALHEERSHDMWDATREAMSAAADAGADTLGTYLAGARAFLEWAWDHRRVSRVFVSGDGPPGFAAVQREHSARWTVRILPVLGPGQGLYADLFTASVNGVVGEGARHVVSTCTTDDEAAAQIDYVLSLVARLVSPIEATGDPGGTG